SAGAGVGGDRLGTLAGTAGKEPLDGAGHLRLELDVLCRPARPRALPSPGPRLLVGQTLPLRTLERLLLDEDSLPRGRRAHLARGLSRLRQTTTSQNKVNAHRR